MKRHKVLITLIVLTAIVDLGMAARLLWHAPAVETVSTSVPASSQSEAATPTPEPQPVVSEVRFSATGDNLIHDGIYKQAAQRAGGDGYDFSYCYQNMPAFYSQFDLNWLNQETLISPDITPSGYPCFATPAEIFPALYDTGFRAFSLSNNHTYDQGVAGLSSTLAFWDTVPEDVSVSGLYKLDGYNNFTYQTVNGITFGYLCYTEHTNGIPTPQGTEYGVVYTSETELIEQQMQAVRPHCDFLIVSCHWGTEGSHVVNDAQRTLAAQLADWGADLIIGTHPHVVQDAEYLTTADGRQAFVVYSLGNFLNYQASADNMIGTILDVRFVKTENSDGIVTCRLEQPQLHPVIMHYDPAFANGRVYLLSDYTEELAQGHGVRAYSPQFSYEYICQVLQENLTEEWIAW